MAPTVSAIGVSRVVAVQVVDVDVVGAEAREAVVAGLRAASAATARRRAGVAVSALPTLVARIQCRRRARIAAPTMRSDSPSP